MRRTGDLVLVIQPQIHNFSDTFVGGAVRVWKKGAGLSLFRPLIIRSLTIYIDASTFTVQIDPRFSLVAPKNFMVLRKRLRLRLPSPHEECLTTYIYIGSGRTDDQHEEGLKIMVKTKLVDPAFRVLITCPPVID